jgi:hypothetical protein
MGGPPPSVINFGMRLIFRLREKVGKGEDLRTTRVPTLQAAAERFIRELEDEHELGQIGSKNSSAIEDSCGGSLLPMTDSTFR